MRVRSMRAPWEDILGGTQADALRTQMVQAFVLDDRERVGREGGGGKHVAFFPGGHKTLHDDILGRGCIGDISARETDKPLLVLPEQAVERLQIQNRLGLQLHTLIH